MQHDGKKESKEESKKEGGQESGKRQQASTSPEEEVDSSVQLARLIEDAGWYSEQISKSVRWISIAVIGGIWSILTTDQLKLSDSIIDRFDTSSVVIAAFILAASALVVDLLHYVTAYHASWIGVDKWKKGFTYCPKDLGKCAYFCYAISQFFFWLKLILAIGAGAALCLVATSIQFIHASNA